jgi:hypothetical protein
MHKDQIIGTWRLITWENRDRSGKVTHPLGDDAVGYISYSDDGHVFVHIMTSNRKSFSTDGLFDVTPADCMAVHTSHISYCGPYEISGDTIIHRVEVCSYPNWIGSEQKRRARFKDGRLILSAKGLKVGPDRVDAHLEWEPFEH